MKRLTIVRTSIQADDMEGVGGMVCVCICKLRSHCFFYSGFPLVCARAVFMDFTCHSPCVVPRESPVARTLRRVTAGVLLQR